MRRSRVGSFPLFLLLLGLASCDGSGSTEPDPPRATTINVSQTSVTLSFVGATVTLTATVRDQNGQPFTGTITWSTDNPSVVTVDAAGLLTAVQNGTATVSATSGGLSGTVTVTVQQTVTGLAIASGGDQSATVGQALAEAVVARAQDAGGAVVSGANLEFVVGSGGGAVGASTVVTDAEGLASTTWTLGTVAGLQQIDVSVEGATAPPVQVSATGLAAAAVVLVKSSGDLQTGGLDLPLPDAIVVQLQDEFGNGVPDAEVTFAVTEGGGTVSDATVTTGQDGTALTSWIIGPAVGPGALTATVDGFPAVSFTATQVIARPDLVPGAISTSPLNPTTLQTVTVTVSVANDGQATTGGTFGVQLLVDGAEAAAQTIGPLAPSATSDVEFEVGPFAAGEHALSVVVDASGGVTESDESNNTSEASVAISAQTALELGTPITDIGADSSLVLLFAFELTEEESCEPQCRAGEAGSIEFRLDGNLIDDADLYIHLGERPLSRDDYETCISGAIDSNESCVINAALPGTYHILIHAFTTFSDATLSVTTGLEVLPFDIEVVFINTPTNAQNDAFTTAAARWESVLPLDIQDIDFGRQPVDADTCVPGQPAFSDVVDDLRIYVLLDSIDGPGEILGGASFCFFRTSSSLPLIGFMQFDTADLRTLESNGALGNVILHEMGHVLGIGTLWGSDFSELLRNPSSMNSGADTHFAGPLAIAAFDAAGGAGYTGGKVPVANVGLGGSRDSHWRESILRKELMTPTLDLGTEPLSAISIQSLADVGYRVDVAQADPFSVAITSAVAGRRQPGQVIDLRNDILIGPMIGVDARGRVVRVIRR